MDTSSYVLLGIAFILILYVAQTQNAVIRQQDKIYYNMQDRYSDKISSMRQEFSTEYNELHHKYIRAAKKLAAITHAAGYPTIYTARVTAYAPYDNQSGICADENPSVTSTGTTPGWGTIAVDPDVIPYGTLLYVPGYGIGIASDTGAALRLYKAVAIDVYMDTYDEAMQWGSQTLDIIVLDTIKKEEWVGLKFVKEEQQHDE